MPISGLIINIDPARREPIEQALNAMPAVELTPTPAGAPLVAVLDVPTVRDEEELFKQIGDLPGVQRVSLSYHNFEDLDTAQVN